MMNAFREGSETDKVMKRFYAQYRLDGMTHEQAMAKLDKAMKEAIPGAVDQIMREAGIPTKADLARDAQQTRDDVDAIRARTEEAS